MEESVGVDAGCIHRLAFHSGLCGHEEPEAKVAAKAQSEGAAHRLFEPHLEVESASALRALPPAIELQRVNRAPGPYFGWRSYVNSYDARCKLRSPFDFLVDLFYWVVDEASSATWAAQLDVAVENERGGGAPRLGSA